MKEVTVVTVTYGRRWAYLSQVLDRLMGMPEVDHVIVVDNASEDHITQQIDTMGLQDRVTVVDMGENAGSAKGYRRGLEVAMKRSVAEGFVYLLDDDNLPSPDALRILLNTYDADGANFMQAYMSIRADRPELVQAAKTGVPLRHIANSFSGFHVKKLFQNLPGIRQTPNRLSSMRDAADGYAKVELDYAPYGGLLMHRKLIDLVGLPDETYYLYADDHDYTSRITCSGGKIFLLKDSAVRDIETSWHLNTSSKAHPLYAKNNSEFRVFYSVRNRVALERRMLVNNNAIYFVNLILYVTFRCLHALWAERDLHAVIQRSKLLYWAISDGLAQRLGKTFQSSGASR